MRIATLITAIACLSACVMPGNLKPKEFLDEQTAVTITMAADPLVFVAARGSAHEFDRERARADQESVRDYVDLHAIDVNRMGTHRQFFAVQFWLASKDDKNAPKIELRSDTGQYVLESPTQDARSLGLSKPLAASYSKNSQWWYFPTDPATMKQIAAARTLTLVIIGERQAAYELFGDGRAQLGELATVLQ